jgi:hypothetical protein
MGWMAGGSSHDSGCEFFTSYISLAVKWPVREADHSPPSSAEVEECVKVYLYSPNMPLWCGAQLQKETQGQLYLLQQ